MPLVDSVSLVVVPFTCLVSEVGDGCDLSVGSVVGLRVGDGLGVFVGRGLGVLVGNGLFVGIEVGGIDVGGGGFVGTIMGAVFTLGELPPPWQCLAPSTSPHFAQLVRQ